MAEQPRVAIVGAGFGGLAAAKRLETEHVEVTVVDRHNFHTFLPLLYQVATAGLSPSDVGYAIRGVFRREQEVLFRKARVVGVDWDSRHVLVADQPPIAFDHLIIAAGSTTNYFAVEGAAANAFPLYTMEDAIRVRNHLLSLFEGADSDPQLVGEGALNFVVVGGGPTGVEVAGALVELIERVLQQDFHDLDVHHARVVLVEQADRLLAPFSERSRRYALETLRRRGVEVRLGTQVRRIGPTEVEFAAGETMSTRLVVWAAGVKAPPLAGTLGVAQGRGGRITVEPDLSVPGHPEAFAIGDIADIDDGRGGRLPQLAQVAIQGGVHAAEQILADRAGRPRTALRYRDKGTMATIGRRAAVAEVPLGRSPSAPRKILHGGTAWLAWLGLHLVYLLGMRNRLSVLVSWAWNYVTWDRGPRLILRPETLPQSLRTESDAVAVTPADEGDVKPDPAPGSPGSR